MPNRRPRASSASELSPGRPEPITRGSPPGLRAFMVPLLKPVQYMVPSGANSMSSASPVGGGMKTSLAPVAGSMRWIDCPTTLPA